MAAKRKDEKPAPRMIGEDQFTIEQAMSSMAEMRQWAPYAGRVVFRYDEDALLEYLLGR